MTRRPTRLGKVVNDLDIVENAVKERRHRVINLDKYKVGFPSVDEANKPSSPKPKDTGSRYYAQYQSKLEKGELSKFSTRDMMYFFRDTAEQNGVKYVIANPKVAMRHFKLSIERGYTKEEILSMIEFLFTSGQTYLALDKIHTGILTTNWCNTIYSDTKLWLDDRYDPTNKYHKQNKDKFQNREWDKEKEESNISIGEWD